MAIRYSERFSTIPPVFGTHVDDIFGGFKNCSNYDRAAHLRDFMCKVGSELTIVFNPKVEKTPLPAKIQTILGRRFNSTTKRVNTDEKKRKKYRLRIAAILATDVTSKKELEVIHGCLNYVAGVEPFGRPFLAHLTMAMAGRREDEPITLSSLARSSLQIWEQILRRNKGIHMDFILDRIPRAASNIFVDASTSWGVGGCCGSRFFTIP